VWIIHWKESIIGPDFIGCGCRVGWPTVDEQIVPSVSPVTSVAVHFRRRMRIVTPAAHPVDAVRGAFLRRIVDPRDVTRHCRRFAV